MAITRPEHLDWCDVQYEVFENRVRIRVMHGELSKVIVLPFTDRIESLMRAVFEAKRQLITTEKVAKALSC
jgi:hypothetical protein